MKYQHFDRIGKVLTVGDIVAYPDSNHLEIGQIVKLNPKKLTITCIEQGKKTFRRIKFPSDLVKLEGLELTVFLLKQ